MGWCRDKWKAVDGEDKVCSTPTIMAWNSRIADKRCKDCYRYSSSIADND